MPKMAHEVVREGSRNGNYWLTQYVNSLLLKNTLHVYIVDCSGLRDPVRIEVRFIILSPVVMINV